MLAGFFSRLFYLGIKHVREMKLLVLFTVMAFAISARANNDDFSADFRAFREEVKRQESFVKGKNISELANEFVAEVKELGKDLVQFFREASSKDHSHGNETQSHRAARSLDDEDGWSVEDLMSEISQLTAVAERESRSDPASGYQAPSPTYAPPSTTSSYTSSYNKKKKGAIVAPAPILIPIPGPPGVPGPPGLPGLPGLPGKTPSLRGLKAILLAKIAKLWLLAKAVALLCLGMFGGNLGLILGLVLPLYGKLKKAGVVLPVQQKEYEQPSYGYEQPAYQPEPSYAAPAPVSDSYIAPIANQVHAAIDQGQAAYGAPPPPYPSQGRRR